jgi:hypothetical protein
MEMFLSLPVLLAIALFIGIVTLVKLLLTPENSLERRSQQDRRKGKKQPEFPFYDSEEVLVTGDRRDRQRDRRCNDFIITIQRYPSEH